MEDDRYKGLEMTRCSSCLEPIPALAVKCRYCGAAQQEALARRHEDASQKKSETERRMEMARYKELGLERRHVPRSLRLLFRIVLFLHHSPAFEFIAVGFGVVVLGVFGYAVGEGLIGDTRDFLMKAAKAAAGLAGAFAGLLTVPTLFHAVMHFLYEHLHLEREERIEWGLKMERAQEKIKARKGDISTEHEDLEEPEGPRMVTLEEFESRHDPHKGFPKK